VQGERRKITKVEELHPTVFSTSVARHGSRRVKIASITRANYTKVEWKYESYVYGRMKYPYSVKERHDAFIAAEEDLDAAEWILKVARVEGDINLADCRQSSGWTVGKSWQRAVQRLKWSYPRITSREADSTCEEAVGRKNKSVRYEHDITKEEVDEAEDFLTERLIEQGRLPPKEKERNEATSG
jgi:hypothetical protein